MVTKMRTKAPLSRLFSSGLPSRLAAAFLTNRQTDVAGCDREGILPYQGRVSCMMGFIEEQQVGQCGVKCLVDVDNEADAKLLNDMIDNSAGELTVKRQAAHQDSNSNIGCRVV